MLLSQTGKGWGMWTDMWGLQSWEVLTLSGIIVWNVFPSLYAFKSPLALKETAPRRQEGKGFQLWGEAESDGEETPVSTDPVSKAIGRGAEKSGISLSVRATHADPEEGPKGHDTRACLFTGKRQSPISEITLGNMGVFGQHAVKIQ